MMSFAPSPFSFSARPDVTLSPPLHQPRRFSVSAQPRSASVPRAFDPRAPPDLSPQSSSAPASLVLDPPSSYLPPRSRAASPLVWLDASRPASPVQPLSARGTPLHSPSSSRSGSPLRRGGSNSPASAYAPSPPSWFTEPVHRAPPRPSISQPPSGRAALDYRPSSEPPRSRPPLEEFQVQGLEMLFEKTPYPRMDEMQMLAQVIDLSVQQIMTWLANRRARLY